MTEPAWIPTKEELDASGSSMAVVEITAPIKRSVSDLRIVYGGGLYCPSTQYFDICLHPSQTAPRNPRDGSVWWDGSLFYMYDETNSEWVQINSIEKYTDYFIGDSSSDTLTLTNNYVSDTLEVYVDGRLFYPKNTETEALEASSGVIFWDYEEDTNTTIKARQAWPDYSRIVVKYRINI